jgi:hypothetical protein
LVSPRTCLINHRLTLLPSSQNPEDTPPIHRVCPPEEGTGFRLAVTPPGKNVRYFDIPDLPSLLDALQYGNFFPRARVLALEQLNSLVELYLDNMWEPDESDEVYYDMIATEDYSEVRKEVFDLVRILCIQEGRLLEKAFVILQSEIAKCKSDG